MVWYPLAKTPLLRKIPPSTNRNSYNVGSLAGDEGRKTVKINLVAGALKDASQSSSGECTKNSKKCGLKMTEYTQFGEKLDIEPFYCIVEAEKL